ncbi:MAG: pantoate--beta-alanine ligase [Nitrococcus sp.]|nr:pantoate--beta-alanine ligase [Nitrococcus sp.]
MQVVQRISELREQVRCWREQRLAVSFVPTMGNLHAGHVALVKAAREQGDRVVVSLFVNPTQFGAGEDYEAYPRSLEVDCARLEALAVDTVFAPSALEIYPAGTAGHTRVDVPALSGILCGAFRPGHFSGVATVVAKLLNIVQPDVAVFGRKDYQQLLVIWAMVADLALPVQVIGVPTVREPDGLACSSRNGNLTPSQRALAPELHRTLTALAQALRAGESNFALLEARGREALEQAGMRPDYVGIRRSADLLEPRGGDTELIVFAAAWLGNTRLIDNVEL